MTTIHISEENWRKMNQIKMLGESMDDVVTRLIAQSVETEERIFDERDIDAVLEEFEEMQMGIDTLIEQSRLSFAKKLRN